MSRFVDIDKPIIVTIYNDPFDDTKSERITTTIAEILENTVEVLEEDIVRCKDCNYWADVWDGNGIIYGYCDHLDRVIKTTEYFFCAEGERKVEG